MSCQSAPAFRIGVTVNIFLLPRPGYCFSLSHLTWVV
ncbi:unnamed protein product, partial [Staurois parvus]